jgi:hypothetical protein
MSVKVPVGTCKGKKDVRHIECGGQLAIGGWATQTVPVGFGDLGAGFQIDTVKISYYSGFCMKCGKEGMFRRTDVKMKAGVRKLDLAKIAKRRAS